MKRGSLVLFGTIILLLTLLTYPKIDPTGYATANSMSIDLDSTKFANDKPISGDLNLVIAQNLNPDEPLILTINGNTYSYTIEQLLKLSNYTIEYEDVEYETANEALQKSLSFLGTESKLIGFKLPRYSNVTDIQFSLVASSSPSNVKMDFGNEGIIDWDYLGEFKDFNTNKISSPDLDTTKDSTAYIKDNLTYYCEFLTLPKTKHLNISTEFTKKSNNGNLAAAILSVPTGNPKAGCTGGSNTCTFSSKNSCTISLDYTIEGDYLLCIYQSGPYTEGETLYEIPIDTSSTTTTAFTCPTKENSVCQETSFTNFFIYAQPANYNTILNGLISISNWETFDNSLLIGLKYYVGSEPYAGVCKSSMCAIPVNITSTNGNLMLKDLSITYTYNDLLQSSSSFYDLTLSEAQIISIESKDLDVGTSIKIPLEPLSINLNNGDYQISSFFLDSTSDASFSVKNPEEIIDAPTLISTAISKYTEYLDSSSEEYKIIKMLGKDSEIQQALNSLNTLKSQTTTLDKTILQQQTETIISNLPWSIDSSQTTSDNLLLEPQNIPSDLGDEETIYKMQGAIDVIGTAKTITLTNYNGESNTYSFIHKEITANGDIENAQLYEKSTISFGNLYSIPAPDSTLTDYLAEYDLTLEEDQTQDYYYLSTISANLNDLKTILVLQAFTDYACGDNICTKPYESEESCKQDCTKKYPWFWIALVGVLALLAILFVLYKIKT
jgi:hypothetical protein